MSAFKLEKKLLRLIEWKRNEMIESASRTGLQSSQTLRKSTELDQLLNLQQKMLSCGTRTN